jgi:hypothetical protein
MSGVQEGALIAPPQRRLLALAGIIFAMFLGLWITNGPVQQASATNFCSNVWLQPFGSNGDRCDAGQESWGHLIVVGLRTYERAGCMNYHGWYGEYYRSWACIGNYAEGSIWGPKDGGSYIPIIRNNNQSYSGKFSGTYTCCW